MAWDGVIITDEDFERAREKVLRRDYQASRTYAKATEYHLTCCYSNQIMNRDHLTKLLPFHIAAEIGVRIHLIPKRTNDATAADVLKDEFLTTYF